MNHPDSRLQRCCQQAGVRERKRTSGISAKGESDDQTDSFTLMIGGDPPCFRGEIGTGGLPLSCSATILYTFSPACAWLKRHSAFHVDHTHAQTGPDLDPVIPVPLTRRTCRNFLILPFPLAFSFLSYCSSSPCPSFLRLHRLAARPALSTLFHLETPT